MRIQLLPPNADQIAEEILSGERPPETDSTEVLEWLVDLAQERGLELEFYRIDNTRGRPEIIELSLKQMTIAVERSIEIRPMPPRKSFRRLRSRLWLD